MKKEVVLSGIRATGKLHMGNYLGAMKFFAEMSEDKSKHCFFFIANLHTLTTRMDPHDIMRDLKEIVLTYISVGIDPASSVIFAQSSVPETSELNWLLACLTSVAELERMPHFKEKKDKKEALHETVNVGLLTYPVLMTADILGPLANMVPVGEDQHPHVELAREIARRFNTIYGETFPIPKLLEGEAVRIPGLDGSGKMGKSDHNTMMHGKELEQRARLFLADTPAKSPEQERDQKFSEGLKGMLSFMQNDNKSEEQMTPDAFQMAEHFARQGLFTQRTRFKAKVPYSQYAS